MSQTPSPPALTSTCTTRRILLATLVVACVIIGFLLIYRFRMVLFIVFTGIVVSMAMAPAVDWLHRHKLTRAVAVIPPLVLSQARQDEQVVLMGLQRVQDEG